MLYASSLIKGSFDSVRIAQTQDAGLTMAMHAQEGLFINKPVYDFQSLDALLVHAYYTTKHLTAANQIGYKSAMTAQVSNGVPC